MAEFNIVVISPTGRSNALGRAMCLAELASELSDGIRLFAPDDGDLWPGARRSSLCVERYTSSRSVLTAVRAISGPLVVWGVKPISASWCPALQVAAALPATRLILDIDDADEALSRQFMSASLGNRLRLHPWHPLTPTSIRRTLARASRQAHGLTYASEAVRDLLDLQSRGPLLRVPHPRHRVSALLERTPDAHINIGFLGTLREHKGLATMERLVADEPRYRLHVFRGTVPATSTLAGITQLVEHDVDAPMAHVYSQIDVVILPQAESVGAQVQLPAKLLDAMRFGKPTVASRSPAIYEAAGDTITYVADWDSKEDVHRKIAAAATLESGTATRAKRRFDAELALEAQVDPLRRFVEAMSAGSTE